MGACERGNNRVGCKVFLGINALAYLAEASVMKKISYMRLTKVVNDIKLFLFVTDDEDK
jgi:hypothetical protein